MEFKKVYSQIPACSIGHTVNDTLSCLKCDMMHIGSSMKLFVDKDQPVPVRTEVTGGPALEAGQTITCKVEFDLPGVTKEEVKVIGGEGLKVNSVEVADKVVTVVVAAEPGIYGPRSIQVGYKGVQKMFSCELVRPDAETKPAITGVTVTPASIEVGGKAIVKITFDKALAADDTLPTVEVTEGLSVDKQPALVEEGKAAEATVAGASAVEEATVTAKLGESVGAAKLKVTAPAAPVTKQGKK